MNLQGLTLAITRCKEQGITEIGYILNEAIMAERADIEAVEIILHEPHLGNIGHTLLIHANGCEFAGDVHLHASKSAMNNEILTFAKAGGSIRIGIPRPLTAYEKLRGDTAVIDQFMTTASVYDGHLDHALRAVGL